MTDDPHRPRTVRSTPCASCPYRTSVPSGVWAPEEYAKLPAYDGDCSEQTNHAAFCCHQTGNGDHAQLCAGWVGHRDHPTDLLAVRLGLSLGTIDKSVLDYETNTQLFDSGAAARDHGMADIDDPGDRAREAMDKITVVRKTIGSPVLSREDRLRKDRSLPNSD